MNKTGVTALALKLGPKLLKVGAKLLKGLKVGKVALFGASALSYGVLFSWQFALLIIVFLFVHEAGHLWAMRRCGMKTKGLYFIPFLGAAAVSEEDFRSHKDEVFVALMGPVVGSSLIVLAVIAYLITYNPLFAAATGWMAMVTLFNLLPINPLDGGRVFKAIAFSIHSQLGFVAMILGILALLLLTWKMQLIIFFVLFIVSSIEFAFFYFTEDARRNILERPRLSTSGMFASSLAYIGLAGILFLTMQEMKHIPGAALALEMLVG